MPDVIDYPRVLDGLLGRGLRSLYHNSGAFGFAADAAVVHRGWVLGPDPTIRPAAMAFARTVEPPTVATLAGRLADVLTRMPVRKAAGISSGVDDPPNAVPLAASQANDAGSPIVSETALFVCEAASGRNLAVESRDVIPATSPKGGGVWVLPKSHWSYELDFGSRAWLPKALVDIDVDPAALAGRNTGDAIAFAVGEMRSLRAFVEQLLAHLDGSDFQLIPCGRAAVCTVHHHQQLWWTTTDPTFLADLDAAVPA